jgi:arylsulfatase A-like enzyme
LLDQGRDWMQHEFGRSLAELQQKLDQRRDTERPIFAYTQPQDIHLIALKNSGYTVPPGEDYPGFDRIHASRIKRMDESFDKFIQFIKARGLYDDSIIILTSDHGDSLGEEGRWGHGPSVAPEIIRVPLIIHLPTSLRQSLVSNPKNIAFLTDITPSLYYLLGHRPIVHSELFGRPLFTATEEEQTAYLHDTYMVGSSYGPVYGILNRDGSKLFIADAVNNKETLYDLTAAPGSTQRRLNEGLRAANENLLRHYIQTIGRFYGFNQQQ